MLVLLPRSIMILLPLFLIHDVLSSPCPGACPAAPSWERAWRGGGVSAGTAPLRARRPSQGSAFGTKFEVQL